TRQWDAAVPRIGLREASVIIIPMAGLSRRFVDAGYAVPKYMLSTHGHSVFSHAVRSFAPYFSTESFLFVVRDVAGTLSFVDMECRNLGVQKAQVIVLDANTRGQAETVELGLARAAVPSNESITIFNIDTFRRNFTFPPFVGD